MVVQGLESIYAQFIRKMVRLQMRLYYTKVGLKRGFTVSAYAVGSRRTEDHYDTLYVAGAATYGISQVVPEPLIGH